MANKPILLLDVDGVINALADSRTILGRGLVAHDAIGPDGRTYRLHLEPETPRRLATLAEHFELAWCTTWGRSANGAIAPLVGLPTDLDTVWLPSEWIDIPLNFSRKTPFVRRWAAERGIKNLVWLDDEIEPVPDRDALTMDVSGLPATRIWQQALAGTPPLEDVLLIRTDPSIGLTGAHVNTLLARTSRRRDA